MEEEFNKALQIIIDKPDISYSGKLDMALVKNLAEQLEIMTREKYDRASISKRVFNIAVELLQNAHRHGIMNEKKSIMVKLMNNKCYIFTENKCSPDKIQILVNRINELNKISNEPNKLIQSFQDLLNMDHNQILFCRKHGIGLGFIEIIRKSKNKILYNFEKIDDQNSKISLIATVDIS